jgi:hypothetical protein
MRVLAQQGEDEGVLATLECWQYRGGRAVIMATSTGPPPASELVWGVAGGVRVRDAEIER